MASKVTITLDDDILAFLAQQAVLAAQHRSVLEAETIPSLKQDAEVAAWDGVAGDRIDAEGF